MLPPESDHLEWAIKYFEMGLNVIPLAEKTKVPIKGFDLKAHYAGKILTYEEIVKIWTDNEKLNIGIITGKHFFVLDVDGQRGFESLLTILDFDLSFSVAVQSGGGADRKHYYYLANGNKIPHKAGALDHVDIIGDQWYIVAPPSIHPETGNRYRFINEMNPWESPILPASPSLLKFIKEVSAKTAKTAIVPREAGWIYQYMANVKQSGRDDALTKVCGYYLNRGLKPDDVLLVMRACNAGYLDGAGQVLDPLPESDVRKVWKSICDKHFKGLQKPEIKNELVTMADLLEQPDVPTNWLIKNLWTMSSVGFIAGESKSYKTYFALDLALSIVAGVPALNQFETKQNNVIFIEEENSADDLRRKIRAFIKVKGIEKYPQLVKNNFKLLIQKRVDFGDEKWKIWIEDLCKNNMGTVLFLDCLARLHFLNENSAEDMKTILSFLRKLQVEYAITIILIHHFKKEGSVKFEQRGQNKMRGSTDFGAWYDCLLTLEIAAKNKTVKVESLHRNAPSGEPFSFDVYDSGDEIELVYSSSANTDDIAIAETAASMERIIIGSGADGISQVNLDASFSCHKSIKFKAHKLVLGYGKVYQNRINRMGKAGGSTPIFWYPKNP